MKPSSKQLETATEKLMRFRNLLGAMEKNQGTVMLEPASVKELGKLIDIAVPLLQQEINLIGKST
jgi:hypothetical protein